MWALAGLRNYFYHRVNAARSKMGLVRSAPPPPSASRNRARYASTFLAQDLPFQTYAGTFEVSCGPFSLLSGLGWALFDLKGPQAKVVRLLRPAILSLRLGMALSCQIWVLFVYWYAV